FVVSLYDCVALSVLLCFFLSLLPPLLLSSLFPYTTLFRSFCMLFANGSPRHMGQWSSYFILFAFSLGTSSPASNEDWSKMPVAGVGVKHFKEVPKANRFMYVN